MKRKILCSLLLCLLILSSCVKEEPSVTLETQTSETQAPESQTPETQTIETEESGTETDAPETEETEPEESESEETEPEPVYITEEEISALMESYLNYEMYTEYDTDAIMDYPDNDVHVIEVKEYNKVVNEKYDTWDEWIAFIESIYCGDMLTEELEYMENNSRFVNIDGYTHVALGGMGWYISRDYTYEILRSNESCALLEIMRTEVEPGEYEKQERHWFYYLINTENGWRIADILNFD